MNTKPLTGSRWPEVPELTVSYGLIESPAMVRDEVDGDDERELYYEACESIPARFGKKIQKEGVK